MKICKRCKIAKEINSFHLDKRHGKPRSYCKICQHEINSQWRKQNKEKVRDQNKKDQLKFKLRHVYKITDYELEKLIQKANGRCMICEKQSALHIDHCHISGQVRGLLCRSCNLAIGLLGDNTNTLKKCIDYLASSGSPGWWTDSYKISLNARFNSLGEDKNKVGSSPTRGTSSHKLRDTIHFVDTGRLAQR